MVRYSVLGSGSCGNSYVFTSGSSSIMVDAGYSMKQLKLRMQDGGFDFSSILALFVTHLHPDHAHAAGVFARQSGKPVYVSRKCRTYADMEYNALNIPLECQRFLEAETVVNVGPFAVSCFYTSHDSAGSVGYRICVEGRTFVIVTDTGVYDKAMLDAAREADVLFLESNYDDQMLRHGPYPIRLQKRVASERGHLSNDQAKSFLLDSGFDKSQRPVYLIHISANNNNVELVSQVMEGFNATVCARGGRYLGEIDGYISENGIDCEPTEQPSLF